MHTHDNEVAVYKQYLNTYYTWNGMKPKDHGIWKKVISFYFILLFFFNLFIFFSNVNCIYGKNKK